MKILHSALMKNFASGIVNQMYDEYISAKDIGVVDFDVKIFSPYQTVSPKFENLFNFYNISNNTSKLLSWIEFRKAYYSWLKEKESEIDIYILRYSAYDFLQYYFIKNSKKPVYLIHHTKELDELRSLGVKGHFLSIIDEFFGNKSIRASAGIIGVTEEIIEYEKNRINCSDKRSFLYPNGIKIKNYNLKDRRNNIPQFLFVASFFYDWHGLDLLIKAVKDSDQEIVIHVVGKVNDSDYLNMQSDKRFHYHGLLSHDEILNIAEQCWLGIGSLALYRKNMDQACTLKVREYLSMGLPTYSGYSDIFPDTFEFYKFGSVDVEKMISYSAETRSINKKEVVEKAIPYIAKDKIFFRLMNEINEANKSLIKRVV